MKRMSCLCIAFFFITQLSCAQGETDTTVGNALLWQITGNDLKTPSYLYGTIQPFCKEDIVLTQNVKDKIAAADKIFLERKLGFLEAPENHGINKKYFSSGYSVRFLIGDKNFYKDAAIINKYRPVAEDTLNRLDLGIFRYLVIEAYLGCDLGSYDFTVTAFVRSLDKKIDVLDEVSDNQSSISAWEVFDRGIPQFLEQYWNNLDYDLWLIKRNAYLYTQQNATALYLNAAYKANGKPFESKERLMDDRNYNWVQIINRNIKRRPCFFAFAASHLAGSKGVITLLRKKGYIVTAVSLE